MKEKTAKSGLGNAKLDGGAGRDRTAEHDGEKLGQERRENGAPWRSKNRPPEIYLRKRSKQERFVGYRRDVYSGAICTSSASGSGRGEKRTAGGPGVWAGA